MMIMCSLFLVMPVSSFADEKKAPGPNESAYEHADENARFKSNKKWFNSKERKRIRAKRLAEKEAAETKKKAEEAQDKGEGQFKIKF